MKKQVTLLVFTLLLLLPSVVSYAQPPAFTGGHVQALAVCRNSDPNPINTTLSVSDPTTGHTVSWSVLTAPAHGTLVGAYTGTSTGGTIMPVGLTYKPNPGYSGSDAFSAQFTDGSSVDTTHINVTVDTAPNPGIINGPASVCVGAHIIYSDDSAGGVWSMSNTAASVDLTGTVTGVSAGPDTIRYSYTNGCGITSATKAITVNTVPNAGHLASPDSVCVGGHLHLIPGGDAGGIWHSASTASAVVNDTGRVTGITPGTSRITYIIINGCGSDTAAAEVKVQTHVLPILGDNTVCQGQTLTLLDPITGGTWNSSSFFVAPVLGGFVFGLMPGSSTITYSIHNACGTTTASLNVTVITGGDCPTAVNTVSNSKEELSIFPNPNNGTFSLNLLSGANEQMTVIVTNVVGQAVKEINAASNQAFEVKLDKPAGVYFVKVLTASGRSYLAKVIVTQ